MHMHEVTNYLMLMIESKVDSIYLRLNMITLNEFFIFKYYSFNI